MSADNAMHSHHGRDHHGRGGVLLACLILTLAFSLIEALSGWWSGSLALLGDAGHMVSDAFALGLAAAAAYIARHPPSYRHSYGLGRAEFIAALLNALLMLAIVVAISVSAVQRLLEPLPVAGGTVTAVALLGLGINLLVAWLLSRGEGDLNTRAALLHVLGDLLGSVAALIAGVVIYYTGWTPIDPLLSLLIVALILVSSLRLLRETVHGLMEGVPLHLSLPVIGKSMAGVEGVVSVHDLHIWSLSSDHTALSAHVVVVDLGRWPATLRALQHLLQERYDIDHVTLQPELGEIAHVAVAEIAGERR